MRFSNLMTGAIIAGTLLTACTADEIAVPKSELYAREFIKKFGVIDPSRDLSAAVHTGINVITSVPTNVKVYADVDGKRYLFAEGRGINGKTQLNFALPQGVNEVIVSDGVYQAKAAAGSTVTMPGSRTINGDGNETNQDGELTWVVTEEKILQSEGFETFVKTYVEDQSNLDKGVNSFYFVADGEEHTFYPFYWNTRGAHLLGIYILEDEANDKISLHDLYYTKTGELKYTNLDNDKVDGKSFSFPTPPTPVEVGEEVLFASGWTDWNTAPSGLYTDEACTNAVGSVSWEEVFKAAGNGLVWDVAEPIEISFAQADAKYFTNNGYISKIVYTPSHEFIFYQTATKAYEIEGDPGFDDPGLWKVANESGEAFAAGEKTYAKTKGITYRIGKGLKYGFYIKVSHTKTSLVGNEEDYDYIIFSHASRNQTYHSSVLLTEVLDENNNPKDVNYKIREYPWTENHNPSLADLPEIDKWAFASWKTVSVDGKDYTLFGFEDWKNTTGNVADLNDVMFMFETNREPSHVITNKDPEPEPYEWLIAAEDLAGTYDWDFNDAVFAVSALPVTNGDEKTTKITVEPLAAGGILPIYVMFNGDILNDEGESQGLGHYHIGAELHSWFGFGSKTQINVRSNIQERVAKAISFTVSGDWSIADSYQDNPAWAEAADIKGMGGFYVLVNPGNTINYNTVAIKKFEGDLNDENHYHMVTPPTKFNNEGSVVVSPEMLCMKAGWRWPMEEQGIHLVYYNFQDWLKGDVDSWYGENDPFDENRTVARR